MSTRYRFSEGNIPHFITLTLVKWIDLFSREKYKKLIIDNLEFYRKNRFLVIYAYVIMTNHLHLIVSTQHSLKLQNIIRDFKRFTAKQIFLEIQKDKWETRKSWLLYVITEEGKKSTSNTRYKIWIHENHPVILETNHMIDQRLEYIHQNPVKAGICHIPESYIYSSAGNYAGIGSPLDITLIDPY